MRVTFSAVLVENTKGPTNCSLKINVEEYWKSIIYEEILKLGMADYVERKKRQVTSTLMKIRDTDQHLRIRQLKESMHKLCSNYPLKRSSIDMNTILIK